MSKRLFLSSLALIACIAASAQYRTPSYRDLTESEAVREMRQDVQYFASAALEGRLAGSEGELEAARYLSARLSESGADLLYPDDGDLFGIRLQGGDTLRSRNVAAVVTGSDKELKNKYILVSARLDNLGTAILSVDGEQRSKTFFGANGNASGLAILIQLARRLQTNRPLLGRSVILAGFGASVPDGAGCWYFLNRSFPGAADIQTAVVLEMLGTGSSGFYAYTASNSDLNAAVARLSATLQPVLPKLVSLEPCKADHRICYDKQIPFTMFTTGMYPEYNTERDTPSIIEYDWMEREVEYLYNYIVELSGAPAPSFSPAEEAKALYLGDSADTVPYYECDVRPSFLGSTDPAVFLKKWVYVYLKYPREAVANGIQGTVLVDFIIDEKGKVTRARVVRSPHELLSAEALRVINASPDWKPGRVRGNKVKAQMSLNIEFILKKR